MHRPDYRKFRVGTRVKVCEGSGIDSNRVGVVINPHTNSEWKAKLGYNHGPIRQEERACKEDNGGYFVMFISRLDEVK